MPGSGTATLDFGAFPGSSHTTVPVTAAGFVGATSLAEAWVLPLQTTDHSPDEHVVESLRVMASDRVDGGFTIHGVNSGSLGETLLYGTFSVGWAWN